MCSTAEWESFVRRIETAVEEGRAREFVSDAAARVDALIDEIVAWTRAAESADWVRGCGRSRPDWIV
jgi:hypothetical protein